MRLLFHSQPIKCILNKNSSVPRLTNLTYYWSLLNLYLYLQFRDDFEYERAEQDFFAMPFNLQFGENLPIRQASNGLSGYQIQDTSFNEQYYEEYVHINFFYIYIYKYDAFVDVAPSIV